MDSVTSQLLSPENFANVMGVSRATVQKWLDKGIYVPDVYIADQAFFSFDSLRHIPQIKEMLTSSWDEELATQPRHPYTSVELFAGAGGLALGMEKAGFHHLLLNEVDHDACRTLLRNRPEWHVVESDIRHLNFSKYRGQVDLLTGGFPCQAFSYAGKQGGFADTRGTLFFELARATQEIQPKVLMAENVRGLLVHDNGRTLDTIRKTISELGYTLVEPEVLRAIMYQVPQKRERLILIAVRDDLASFLPAFSWPQPYKRVMTLRDAFFAGELFSTDVPSSEGQKYPEKKRAVMELVPQGGCWKDLPLEIQKEYMGGSFHLEGGKTGMARRLSLDEPSLTLTCAPAQKQTERCHPLETRPLNVREYARIQTFPDDWIFEGSLSAKYKQIGNAVPVNLAYAIGRSLVRLLNAINE